MINNITNVRKNVHVLSFPPSCVLLYRKMSKIIKKETFKESDYLT